MRLRYEDLAGAKVNLPISIAGIALGYVVRVDGLSIGAVPGAGFGVVLRFGDRPTAVVGTAACPMRASPRTRAPDGARVHGPRGCGFVSGSLLRARRLPGALLGSRLRMGTSFS